MPFLSYGCLNLSIKTKDDSINFYIRGVWQEMNKFHQSILIAVMFSFGISTVSAAPENIPGTNLTVDFSESILSGAGRLIRATNIPVQSGGTTVYYDVEMDFKILSDNSFGAQLISVTPSTGPVESTSISTMNFLPGTYKGIVVGAGDGASPCSFLLNEPSIGSDGRRTYILTATSNEYGCPGKTSFTWQTGPAVHNGIISSLLGGYESSFVEKASLTHAYGSAASNPAYPIRVMQVGDAITIDLLEFNGNVRYSVITISKQ